MLGTGMGLGDVSGSGQGDEPGMAAAAQGCSGGACSLVSFALVPPQPLIEQQKPKYSSAAVLLLQEGPGVSTHGS